MVWLETVPTFGLAAALILIPGLATLRLMGVSLVWSVAFGPAASLGLATAALGACWLLRIPWNPVSVLVLVIVTAGLARLAHHALARKWPRTFCVPMVRVSAGDGIAALVAILVCYIRFSQIIGSPDAISQGIDAPFHVNLIRLILDEQRIGPFVSGDLMDSAPIYPPLWHGVGALVVQLTGASIPLASNAVNGAVVAVAWPLSVLALTRCVAGSRPSALIPAGLASAAIYAFPWTPIQGQWADAGALFPFTMSTAILPVIIPLAARLFGLLENPFVSRPMAITLMLATVGALAMSQPSGVVAAGSMCASLAAIALLLRLVRLMKQRSPFVGHLRLVSLGLLLLVSFFVFWMFARPNFVGWGAFTDFPRAIAGALLNAPLNGPVPWAVALASFLGVLISIATRRWWFLAPYVAVLYLYVVGAASNDLVFRAFTIGAWWGDNQRTAAMLPIFAVPCVGLFTGSLGAWLTRRRGQRQLLTPRIAERAMTAVIAVPILLSALVFPGSRPHDPARASSFGLSATSPILTSDEMTLLGRLDRFVPPGSTIANNPWDGSSMAYALTDRKVLFPHAYLGTDADPITVASDLHNAKPGSAVCGALKRLHAEYALDFGNHRIDPYRSEIVDFAGFQGLDASSSFQLLDRQGDARLYRIVGCS